MIARVKKKFVFGLLGILTIFSQVSAFEGENKTVVMKISNETNNLHPRKLISRHNMEVRERNQWNDRNSTTDAPTQEKDENSSESTNYQMPNITPQTLYFPYNLLVISEILQKLENKNCVAATTHVIKAMTRHERWALELFDSFAKFPVGILYGNYYQMGNFDECVGAQKLIDIESVETLVRGQYCLADIHFKSKSGRAERSVDENNALKVGRNVFNNSVIHWGICLPSTCTTEDAEIFTREIFSSSAENFEVVSVSVGKNKCKIIEPIPFTTLEIVYGCTIGSIIIFTCLATTIHLWYLRRTRRSATYNVETFSEHRSKNILKELLFCFSIIHTTGKFLQTKSNELNLECICGIKCLSMILIITGHCLVFIFGGPLDNRKFLDEELANPLNGPLLNNPLLVDSFLLVSGFLMCRLLLIELDRRKGKLNVVILYVARYIRLTPAYLIVIGIYSTFLYRLGSGPFWESRIGLERDRCLRSWWTNILYVNNYINSDQLCMFQSWYLAVDYHLFIIAPLIIYPLWWSQKTGKLILFACTVVSAALPFWITYKENLDPSLLAHPPELEDISTNFYFMKAYIKTHMRSSSYCIGIFLGYLVHKLQTSGIKIPSCILVLGSILAVSLGVVSMYSIAIFYSPSHLTSSLENAIYASLHRVAWCLAVGWIILLCVTGNAVIINKFLSFKLFIPLSRLTYCAYLANGIVEVYNMGVMRQPKYLSRYELLCSVFAHIGITYAIAFVLCIMFESPIHGMEKLLLKRDRMKNKKNQP